MERITVKYYRADTPYLSPEAIEEIIQSRGTIKNACKEMVDRYSTSTRRIYEIWKRHAQGLPQRKQQMIQNTFPSEIASMPGNNISNERTKKKKSSSKLIRSSHSTSNSGGKMEKISGGGMNNIPNTDIVAQIEREIKRKDKNLANTARIMSTT
ncbi:10672_t:CDS:1 [Entrophospora sp. SA101]|nr:5326_t:CDS:1 [Entrophospora sp. SA101]CAJ0840619.1 13987_t:CDS:1 [Entrophospora sp. SA101]CAJ0903106.1 10672_t:CDS:1 [Entrophospora sp. SA101]